MARTSSAVAKRGKAKDAAKAPMAEERRLTLVDLTPPPGVPTGFPVHGSYRTPCKDGSYDPHSCGGLIMLPQQAGRRPSGERTVVCTVCSKRPGAPLVEVCEELYKQAVAVAKASGVSLDGPAERPLLLLDLSPRARVALSVALAGDPAKVKLFDAKPVFECMERGLISADWRITEKGRALAKSAGWIT